MSAEIVTPPNYQQAPSNFNLQETLEAWKRAIFLELNCHAIATVQSVDTGRQVLTAQMNYGKTFAQAGPNGDVIAVQKDYAILVDCPFIIMGGGGASLTFPVAQGDECVIMFNDRDIDNWFAGASRGSVATNRAHSFADAMALVGFPLNPVFDPMRALLAFGANGAAVGVEIATKVKIYNNLTTLNTLLQNLCTQLQAITVTCAAAGNPSSVPLNAAAIASIASQIGGLLE